MSLAAGFHADDSCPHCDGTGIIRAGQRMGGSPLREDSDEQCDCVREDSEIEAERIAQEERYDEADRYTGDDPVNEATNEESEDRE